MADDALIHGRWHRALDDLSSEPDGPIRDHIEAHDARVRRDLAAKFEALCEAEEQRCRGADPAYQRIHPSQIRALLADALPQEGAVEPSTGPLAAEPRETVATGERDAAWLSEAQRGDEAALEYLMRVQRSATSADVREIAAELEAELRAEMGLR